MRVKLLPGLLWVLLVAVPVQVEAGCEGQEGTTVQVSDVVEVAEIMDSGPYLGQAVYTLNGTPNNLSCGGSTTFLYDGSGQLTCGPGRRVSAEGLLQPLSSGFAVFADSVSCE